MDYRLYILAGTFLLVLIALGAFLAVLNRARQEDRFAAMDVAHHDPATVRAELRVDTNLDGLDVALSADAPSASLLTPLRTGEWQPPDEPAPAERLPQASLGERIAEYAPPTPGQSAPEDVAHSPWMIDADRLSAGTEAAPQFDLHELEEQSAPTPRVVPSSIPEVYPSESDDDFGAEIAALLPAAPIPMPAAPVEMESVAAVFEPRTAVSAPAFESPSAPVIEPEALPGGATGWPDFAEPESTPIAEPEVALAPEPVRTPAPTPAPASEPAPAPTPVPQAAPAPEPPLSSPAPDAGDEFWQALLQEQQGQRPMVRVPSVGEVASSRPTAQVSAPPAEPRPEVTVPAAPPPAAVRPQVRVASLDGRVPGTTEPVPVTPHARPARALETAPELTMAAPVEMWFGDSRIGVKAGTATYDRFRKYADSMLADLKDARAQSR